MSSPICVTCLVGVRRELQHCEELLIVAAFSHGCHSLLTVTTKPVIYVVNLSSKNFIRKGSKWLPKINEWVQTHGGGQIIPISCDFEQTLFDMKDDPEGQKGELRRLLALLSHCAPQH